MCSSQCHCAVGLGASAYQLGRLAHMPHSTHKKTADMDAVEDGQVPFQALEGCICWARDAPLVIALPLLCMRPCLPHPPHAFSFA